MGGIFFPSWLWMDHSMLLHVVLRPPRVSLLFRGKEAAPSSRGLCDFRTGEGYTGKLT